jgi:hypothetical protein
MLAAALTESLTVFVKYDFLWTHYLNHFRDPGFNYFRVCEWFSCVGQYVLLKNCLVVQSHFLFLHL